MKLIIVSHLAILSIPMYFSSISAATNFQISMSNRNLHKNLRDNVHPSRSGEEDYLITSEENNEYQDIEEYTTFPPDPLSSSESFAFSSSKASHLNRNKNPYATRMKSERFWKNRNSHKLNRDLFDSNAPSFRRTMYKLRHAINPVSENRGYYLDRYFPVLRHHNYRPDYRNSALRPHFHSNYYNLNYENLLQRGLMDNLILSNEIPSTAIYASSNLEHNATSMLDVLPPFLRQPKAVGSSSPHLSETSRWKEYDTPSTAEKQLMSTLSRISKSILEPKSYNSSINLRNKKMEQDHETLTSLLRSNSTRNINFHDSHRESQTSSSGLRNDLPNEKESNISHSESLEPLQNDKKETSSAHIVQDKEMNLARNERNLPQDDSIIENVKLSGSKRVYYEKLPQNLNLSWYVYLNCSRDLCLLTNTTNETELINEGWILHNCSTYGCVEMYPKTESIQRFIGLLLLVFSLCILKIVGFLLVFYYCRHIKLSKNGSDDGKGSLWNEKSNIINKENELQWKGEDKQNSPRDNTRLKKDKVSVNSELKQTGDWFLESNPVKVNVHSPDREKRSPYKVWVPPIQNITPCLLPSENNRSVLIPNKSCEKSIPVNNSSGNLMKQKKNRSNIPRLTKRPKSVVRNDVAKQTTKMEKMSVLKPLKCEGQSSEKNEDLLLMSWDDDVLTENLYFPSFIENTPNWDSMVRNESKSFIRLDLNKPEASES